MTNNPALHATTRAHYDRLARWLARRAGQGRCPVIGINGAQGSGKSTLAHYLAENLARRDDVRVAVLSLDDCYLPRAERELLARRVHPLFAARGVPGTHDPGLGADLVDRLRALGPGQALALPRFSKAHDDRAPPAEWPQVQGPFDLVLLEGWCVGTPPQDAADLATPVNALESTEDRSGAWRRYVNDQLHGAYAGWFARLDGLVFLQVPNFECVHLWRWQQECETAARAGAGEAGLMSREALGRFIQHYERLTRHALAVLPQRADASLRLDVDHGVSAIRLP